jgi:hypothetical protein
MMDEYEVLNGTVKVGDRVAYASRSGNTAVVHVGVVVGHTLRKDYYEGEVLRLKVRVETESWGCYGDKDRIRGIEKLDRVVKI